MTPDEYDPEATVWSAVAELERKRFTKIEIVQALQQAVTSLLDEQQSM